MFKADDDEVVRVGALLTSLLKVTWLSDLALKAFKANDNKVVEVGILLTLPLKVTRLLDLA